MMVNSNDVMNSTDLNYSSIKENLRSSLKPLKNRNDTIDTLYGKNKKVPRRYLDECRVRKTLQLKDKFKPIDSALMNEHITSRRVSPANNSVNFVPNIPNRSLGSISDAPKETSFLPPSAEVYDQKHHNQVREIMKRR